MRSFVSQALDEFVKFGNYPRSFRGKKIRRWMILTKTDSIVAQLVSAVVERSVGPGLITGDAAH